METLRWSNLQPSIQNWWCVNGQAWGSSPSWDPLPTLTHMHTRMQALTIAAHELNPSKLDLPSMKSRFAKECMLWLRGRSCGVLAQRGSSGCPSSTHYQSVNIYSSTSLLSNHHTIDHVRIEVRERGNEKHNGVGAAKTINTLSLPPASHKT